MNLKINEPLPNRFAYLNLCAELELSLLQSTAAQEQKLPPHTEKIKTIAHLLFALIRTPIMVLYSGVTEAFYGYYETVTAEPIYFNRRMVAHTWTLLVLIPELGFNEFTTLATLTSLGIGLVSDRWALAGLILINRINRFFFSMLADGQSRLLSDEPEINKKENISLKLYSAPLYFGKTESVALFKKNRDCQEEKKKVCEDLSTLKQKASELNIAWENEINLKDVKNFDPAQHEGALFALILFLRTQYDVNPINRKELEGPCEALWRSANTYYLYGTVPTVKQWI